MQKKIRQASGKRPLIKPFPALDRAKTWNLLTVFRAGIKRRGGFVDTDQARLGGPHKGPCQRESLPLAAAQVDGFLP